MFGFNLNWCWSNLNLDIILRHSATKCLYNACNSTLIKILKWIKFCGHDHTNRHLLFSSLRTRICTVINITVILNEVDLLTRIIINFQTYQKVSYLPLQPSSSFCSHPFPHSSHPLGPASQHVDLHDIWQATMQSLTIVLEV